MDKKYIYTGIGIFVLFLLIFIIAKYFNGNVINSGVSISGDIAKIEVIHFHGTNQCYSCVALGDLAEETIKTYFNNELKSGKVVFSHINVDNSSNFEISKKYGVTGSSLWIGTYYSDGTFKKEENINVWYKIRNKTDYMNYLKGVIDIKLISK